MTLLRGSLRASFAAESHRQAILGLTVGARTSCPRPFGLGLAQSSARRHPRVLKETFDYHDAQSKSILAQWRCTVALIRCAECGKEVSSNASACPHCGNPIASRAESPPVNSNPSDGTYCPSCKRNVTPVVTSVGGGTCSFGKRETWKCPSCKRVLHRSGCFVATVTYGDEDIVEVKFLRAFRDEILSQSRFGKFIIWIYYKSSPYAARIVEILPPLRWLARRLLDYIVVLIERKTCLQRANFRAPLP